MKQEEQKEEEYVTLTHKSVKQLVLGAFFALLIIGSLGTVWATFYAGSSDIDMQGSSITNLGTPSGANDVATKAYVDNNAGGVTFRGVTDTSIDGDFGSWVVGNAICNGNYSGSHMCTMRELVQSGINNTIASASWVFDDLGRNMLSEDATYLIRFQIFGLGYDAVNGLDSTYEGYKNCRGWTTADSRYYGSSMQTSGYTDYKNCATTERLACCGG